MASLAALGGYCDSSSSDEDDDYRDCERSRREELTTLEDENKEVITTSSSSKDIKSLPSAELLLESTETPSWLQQQVCITRTLTPTLTLNHHPRTLTL